jgi:protein TonB
MKQALQQSILIHLTLLITFLLLSWVLSKNNLQFQKIKIQITEAPFVENKAAPQVPVVQISKPPVIPQKETRKVFGLSRNALTTDAPGAVEVKAGNTLAKEIDQEKLRPEDADDLPVPTEEYLVTSMPRLKSEVRIPYPPEAKKKNIEGVVIMNILIDEKGKVRQAELQEGPGYGLNEAALAAIYNFEFTPAIVGNKAVAVKIRYAYRFILN